MTLKRYKERNKMKTRTNYKGTQIDVLREMRYDFAKLLKVAYENNDLQGIERLQNDLKEINLEIDFRDAIKYAMNSIKMEFADAIKYAKTLYKGRR